MKLTFGKINNLRYFYDYVEEKKEKNMTQNSDLLAELKVLNSEKDRLIKRIYEEMESAAEYVMTLLPAEFDDDKLHATSLYFPASSIGGDTFGYGYIDKENFSFYLLDVCGHGIKSTLHSVTILHTLNNKLLRRTDFKQPAEVLFHLNNRFLMSEYNELYFTTFYAVYNTSKRTLRYAGAGNPPVFLIHSDGSEQILESENRITGFLPDTGFSSRTIEIPDAAEMYLFTDGVYDFKRSNGIHGNEQDIFESIRNNRINHKDELQNIFIDSISNNGDRALADDFTVLRISFKK